MDIIPYRAEHLRSLQLQDAQIELSKLISYEQQKALKNEHAYTFVDDGEILLCAGVMPLWEKRAIIWSYFSRNAGRKMRAIIRATVLILDEMPFDRIESAVEENFSQGHRFNKLIGFNLETPEPMQKYFPTGSAAFLYSRVKQ